MWEEYTKNTYHPYVDFEVKDLKEIIDISKRV
jgi:hypothetical protein